VSRDGAPAQGDPHLAEVFVEGEAVYSGVLLQVRRDTVRLPNGRAAVREYIRHPGAAVIVPLFDDEQVLLERQFRYPHGRVMVELPAGKLDPGEPHLETAQRELREETGYEARDWTRLGVIHPSVAYTDEAIEIYLARGLAQRGAKLDDDEFLETFLLPFGEALEWVRTGRISDAKSVAGLLWVRAFLRF
jgi:ADP-ribose pyrophosphatase